MLVELNLASCCTRYPALVSRECARESSAIARMTDLFLSRRAVPRAGHSASFGWSSYFGYGNIIHIYRFSALGRMINVVVGMPSPILRVLALVRQCDDILMLRKTSVE